MNSQTTEFFEPSSNHWVNCDPTAMTFWGSLNLSESTNALITLVPFWSDTYLVRLEDIEIASGCWMWFLIHKHNNAYFLSGNSDSIFMVNRDELPKWDAESLLLYLKFFCYFMRGANGSSFFIIDSIENNALSALSGETRNELHSYIKLPKLTINDDRCDIEACVWYGGSLYQGRFLIKPSGEVIMESDELLCELNIKPLAPMITSIRHLIKKESLESNDIENPSFPENQQAENPPQSTSRHEIKQNRVNNSYAEMRVMDHIELSDNPEVSTLLQRYAWLEDSLCDLVLVPDLAPINHVLQTEFPWFREVTNWVMVNLSIKALTNMPFYLSPFLLAGPPGIGKTAYCSRLAKLTNLGYRQIPLAGKSDSRDLVGTARGWSGCNPAMPIRLINECRIANPLIVLDEIDKVGESTNNGHIWSALHEFLEPECSMRYYDEFLGGHANLCQITWVATANELSKFPASLRQRFKIFHIKGPAQEDYPGIVMRTIQQFAKQHHLDQNMIPRIDVYDWDLLKPSLTNPRIARRATETWLAHRLVNPGPSEDYH